MLVALEYNRKIAVRVQTWKDIDKVDPLLCKGKLKQPLEQNQDKIFKFSKQV
jgi:hypothetical protein